MSNTYWRRFLLRNDYAFDNIIEEVARDYASEIRAEDASVPYHEARLAMANRVLAERDEVVSAFFRELKDRAVRESAFLNAAFEHAQPDASGHVQPRAMDIPDELLIGGVANVWNEVALIAWPTILDDIAGTDDADNGMGNGVA